MKKQYRKQINLTQLLDEIKQQHPELFIDIEGGQSTQLHTILSKGVLIMDVPENLENSIDSIVNNHTPTPRTKPQKTRQEITDEMLQEFADRKGYDVV